VLTKPPAYTPALFGPVRRSPEISDIERPPRSPPLNCCPNNNDPKNKKTRQNSRFFNFIKIHLVNTHIWEVKLILFLHGIKIFTISGFTEIMDKMGVLTINLISYFPSSGNYLLLPQNPTPLIFKNEQSTTSTIIV